MIVDPAAVSRPIDRSDRESVQHTPVAEQPMSILFELVLQVVGELLVQLLLELGLHTMAEPFRRTPDRWLAAIAYVLFGAIVGILSVAMVPSLFVRSQAGRLAMLLVVPVIAAAATTVAATWRQGFRPPYRPSLLAHAYLFALTMSLVRYFSAS